MLSLKEMGNIAFATFCIAMKEDEYGKSDLSKLQVILDESRIELNDCEVKGESILFLFIHLNSPVLVEFFIKNGGNPNIRNRDMHTPLTVARQNLTLLLKDPNTSKQAINQAREIIRILKKHQIVY